MQISSPVGKLAQKLILCSECSKDKHGTNSSCSEVAQWFRVVAL